MTTIHNPSHAEFDPTAYKCFGVFDLHSQEGSRAARAKVVNMLVDRGFRFDASSGQCAHCGHALRYAALMTRVLPDGRKVMVDIGEQCLDNRFDLDRDEFQRLRKAASLNSKRRAASAMFTELAADHAWIAWALDADLSAIGGATRQWESVEILGDLLEKARRYGSLSDKQHAFGERLVGRLTEAMARLEQRKSEDQALIDSGVALPIGRVEIEGEILSLKVVESMYGEALKCLVRADAGWRVWGTVPRALAGAVERGDRVAFTATIAASDDDPLFGFYSRPTKARVSVPA